MNTREQFGKYLLLKKLTEDPLGETFRAGMLGEGGMERVALLRVFNGQGVDGQRLWQATQDRVEIPGLLRNPNIGEGVEMGQIEGIPYVAYEYISGKNMANLLEQAARSRNYIPAEHALLITERVALALAAACENRLGGERILHGFVSPHLVMISNEGESRLLGFEVGPGLRTFAANPVIRQHFGRYLSPETLAGQPPNPADDIYSLGVLLFELMTGRPLPPPAADGFAAIIDQAVVATEGTPIPKEIADLLKRSLVPREHRIADVASWHKTLNKLMFDGQYNPTTFNLAFFMHNLFRQDIERESQEIEVEKTLPLPTIKQPPASAPAAAPAAAAPHIPTPAATQPITPIERPFSEGTGVTEAPEVSEKTENFIPEYAREPKKSKVGLIAALVALLLLAVVGIVWFTSRGGAGEAPVAAEPIAVDPQPEVPAGPSEEELNERIKELIAQQATSMEDELRKEYDQQLEDLQKQLEKARQAEARRKREAELAAQRAEEEAAKLAEAEAEAGDEAEGGGAEAGGEAEADDGAEAGGEAVAETGAEAEGQEGGGPAAGEPAGEPQVAEVEPPPVAPPPVAPPPPAPPRPAQVRRGDLVEMGPGVQPPKLKSRPTPRFPEQARRLNRQEAKVFIRVLIDETGKVIKAELVGKEQGYGFDAEALKSARRSVYTPASKDGVPVKIWHTLAVEFRR